MGKLKDAVEERKSFIINRLLKAGYTKTSDGKQLYELTLTDLERLYIDMRCQRAQLIEIEKANPCLNYH